MSENTTAGRKFLSIMFDCCNTYSRIYINADKTAYQGRCPRCLKPLRVGISSGGSSERVFRAQ